MSIRLPVGDGSGSGWTAVGAANKWSCLDTNDGDTKYLSVTSGATSNGHYVDMSGGSIDPAVALWKIKYTAKRTGDMSTGTYTFYIIDANGRGIGPGNINMSALTTEYVDYIVTVLSSQFIGNAPGDPDSISCEFTTVGNTGFEMRETYLALGNWVITASSDSHSAFDQEGYVLAVTGDNVTLTATPSAGYRIADVLVDGVSVGDAAGSSSYVKTFTNVTADHTISVTSYLYTAPAPGNAQGMTNSGEYVNFVYDFSQAIEAEGLAQVLGPGGQGFPWSSPLILNTGAMVRTWDGNLYGANDANTGATSNGAIYQLDTGLYDTPVKVQGYTTGLNYVTGSLVQSTGVITATAATDFFRVAVGAKITGSGITGTATVTAKSSNGDTITVTGTLTGNTTNQQYTCWGREIEARAVFPCDRFGMMGDEVSGQFATVAYACPTGELIRVQHSYDFSRATMVPMELPATGAANATTHRAPQDRAKVELPSASRTTSQLQEFAVLMYNGSAGTDTLGRSECWGLESTNRILRSYR